MAARWRHLQDPRSLRTMYKIKVKTSDRSGAGTDANVYIDMRGDNGASGEASCRSASKGHRAGTLAASCV